MSKQAWVLMVLGFVFSCTLTCGLFALEAKGITHLLDDQVTGAGIQPGDTVPEYITRSQGNAMLHQAGQCLIPAALGVSGLLGVGLVIGVIVEVGKRL